MSWSTSNRRQRLPDNWNTVRNRVLSRDFYRCCLSYDGCLGKATDVDHIHPGDDNRMSNLQSACSRCHRRKSSLEGNRRKRQLHARRKRPSERHPGSL